MGVAIPQVVTEDRAGGAQIIDGSLRFDKTKTQYLRRTISTPTSVNTWTFSCWIKRNSISYSEYQYIFSYDSTASRGLAITATIDGNPDCFYIYDGANINVGTARKVRDASAWYHLVLRCSSGTATLYLNGESSPYITAAATMPNMSNGQTMGIGLLVNTSILPLDAQLSNLYFIDGQALDPSYFGYTDPLTNTWRPKKLSSSVAFGTNGFYLPFDGSALIGQDQSGRGNNWTPVNFGGSNTLEKATGALPILNTDGGGKVARVGVRTDSNASSLVLALPLVGIKSDFSNAINSGTSNKTITESNTTYVSTTGNFYGGSLSFNGSSTYINTSGLSVNSSTFTVEFWINFNAFNGVPVMTSTSSRGGIGIYFPNSSTLNFVGGTASGSWNVNANITVSLVTGTWYHFAVVRNSGGTFDIYKDGVLLSSVSSGSITHGELSLGRQGGDNNLYFNGYIQDLRIYSGLAKYTQNFIPASTDPDILPDTPSGVAYSSNVALVPSTDGAVAFDGSGDYLSLANTSDFDISTGNWTIEGFLYTSSPSSTSIFLNKRANSGTYQWVTIGLVSGQFSVSATSNGSSWDIITTNTSFGTAVANKWHHWAVVRNGNTFTGYLDGVGTVLATSSSSITTNTTNLNIGSDTDQFGFLGLLSNVHIVKGTALYTSNFTPPTAPITSVANTKLLCCKSQTSATAADVTPGTITANGNAAATNFNPFTVNINTQRGQESGYCTLNPLYKHSSTTLANGNLDITASDGSVWYKVVGTVGVSTGKWYWESGNERVGGSGSGLLGIAPDNAPVTNYVGYESNSYAYYNDNGSKYSNATGSSYGSTFTTGDVIGVALDMNIDTLTFYKNGVSQGTAFSGITGTYCPAFSSQVNYKFYTNFGQKPFKFPPPAGFQPLALANTPRPTIVRPDQYVGIVTYTGNGVNPRPITVGWKPDFVWIKMRQSVSGGIEQHMLMDSVRGARKYLVSNSTAVEGTNEGIQTFDPYGFSVDSGWYVNRDTGPYVAWAWKAGGNSNTYNINDIGYSTASAAGLTAGTITPTGASVNTKSGFSIVTWTGAGSIGDLVSVPHGLQSTPAFVVVKSRSNSDDWYVWHKSFGNLQRDYIRLNTTGTTTTALVDIWGNGMTSSTTGYRNGNFFLANWTMVTYAWAEIPGFSKFGTYTGNGSTDGVTVVTGFRPAIVLMKKTSGTSNWFIHDSGRNRYNAMTSILFPNLADQEDNTYGYIDFLSNGFKLRFQNTDYNTGSATYIYCAFAETPSFNLYGGQANAR